MADDGERHPALAHAYIGLWFLAGIGFALAVLLDMPFIGSGVFAALVLGAAGLEYYNTGELFTEEDRVLHEEVSGHTTAVLGVVAAVTFPALAAADVLGVVPWPAGAGVAALVVAAVFIAYGLVSFVMVGDHDTEL